MLRSLMRALADLLYPHICLVCKKRLPEGSGVDNLVCRSCWSMIKRNLPPFCFRCGRHLEYATRHMKICPRCIKRTLHFDRAFSPCVYEGVIKKLIQEFKYKHRDYLGAVLSLPLIEFIREYNVPMEHIDLLIPLPLHKARQREREFNQAEVLGRQIAEEFRKTLSSCALLRHRYTQAQIELEEEKRFSNIRMSFSVADQARIKDKNILLIDDVLTTGATASEAALTLKDAGANIVFVLTLAN